MTDIKNTKFNQLNEYGELIVSKAQLKIKTVLPWQFRFFKAMAAFLAITLIVLAAIYY